MLKTLLTLCVMTVAMNAFSLGSQEDFYRVSNQIMSSNMSNDRLGVINWPFSKCGTNNGVNVLFVQMATKPAIGSGAAISVIGQGLTEFIMHKVGIKVYYKGIFLINEDGSQGDKLIKKGETVFYQYKVDIPSYAFHGHYKIQLVFNDSNNVEQCCTEIEMDL